MPFQSKVSKEQVIQAWHKSDGNLTVQERLDAVGADLGVSALTIRRYLTQSNIIGRFANQTSVQAEAREAASRLVQVLMPPSPATAAASLVLSDILTRQRKAVAGLSDTEQRLSVMLSQLTGGAVDEYGDPLPMSEDVIHRAVASYAKLVDATAKRTELERKVWGIRDDEGSSYAQTLEELAQAPHPSDTPPSDFSGT